MGVGGVFGVGGGGGAGGGFVEGVLDAEFGGEGVGGLVVEAGAGVVGGSLEVFGVGGIATIPTRVKLVFLVISTSTIPIIVKFLLTIKVVLMAAAVQAINMVAIIPPPVT